MLRVEEAEEMVAFRGMAYTQEVSMLASEQIQIGDMRTPYEVAAGTAEIVPLAGFCSR